MKNNLFAPILLGLIVVGITSYAVTRNPSPQEVTTSSSAQAVSYACEEGKTAYDVLAAKYEVTTNDTSFGKQVIGIAGTEATGNQYWAFYASGQLAPVGADAYQCQGSETIEWKMESF